MQENVKSTKIMLEEIFGGKVRVNGNTLKTAVNEINDFGVNELSNLSTLHACNILLKRSGTSITIIVTV